MESKLNCRMCLEPQEEFILLQSKFESFPEISYFEAYNFCTKLNAFLTDPYPKILCVGCASNLTFIYETIQYAIKSDKVLRGIIEIQPGMEKCKTIKVESKISNDEDVNTLELSSNVAVEEHSDIEEFADYEVLDTNNEDYILKSEDEDSGQQADIIELQCPICEIVFLTEKEFLEHSAIHEETPKSPEVVVHEEENQIPEENNKKKCKRKSVRECICEICGKCFKSSQKLNQHIIVHTKEKNFPCDSCPKRFATIYRLRYHTKAQHSPNSSECRKYECHICHQKFMLKHTLAVHIRRHTGERPYKCSICDKSFSQPSILRAHVKLHTGKNIKCDVCSKTFCLSSQLTVHYRSHTGERPYMCSLCPNGYRQKSHLVRHMDTHMGVKHKCKICGKEYSKKSTLTAHMFIHSDVKNFKCEECSLEFSTRARYHHHRRQTHKMPEKEKPPKPYNVKPDWMDLESEK